MDEHPMSDMTTIETSRFGRLTIDSGKIITMVSPFLGFPDDTRFVLVPHGEASPFWWLQSVDSPRLAFVVIRPGLIKPDYSPAVPRQYLRELRAASQADLELLVILTIPQGRPAEMTANLLGPVALNATAKLARQVLLDPNTYSPCWPVPLSTKTA